MSIKIQTYWAVLIQYSNELSKAEKSGNKEWISRARFQHDEYKELCLRSDKLILPCRVVDLC